MGSLEGRVTVVTGAGRGLGREHALLFAQLGAKVVVNDIGTDIHGEGVDESIAHEVVNEIHALGGDAIANTDGVSSWQGSKRLIDTAIEAFGSLHVLVNNAGFVRHKTLVEMSEEDWDSIMDVHLKGHFCPLHWASVYWQEKAKKMDAPINATVINTTSVAGLFGYPGMSNYAAAKAGIASMTIAAARELAIYGVRANAIAPGARTRLWDATPLKDLAAAPQEEDTFDRWHPVNVSSLVAYLAREDCPFTGQVFSVLGADIVRCENWSAAQEVTQDRGWTIESLATALENFPRSIPDIPLARMR